MKASSATMVLLSACLALLLSVCASRAPVQSQQIADAATKSDLNTYFITTSDVEIKLVGHSPRPGTTRVQMKLKEGQVGPAMPVITTALSGVVHNVIKTWTFMKNYALLSKAVDAVNNAASPNAKTLYPVPAAAMFVSSALDNSPTHSLPSLLQRADSEGQRRFWAHTAPASVLLLPPGQATGAIADIMSAELSDSESASPTLTLTMDVVHEPHLISEFKEHGMQTLDDAAHYHFYLPEGVTLDAAKFRSILEANSGKLSGLHIFAKGGIPGQCAPANVGCCGPTNNFLPPGTVCASPTASQVCLGNATCIGTSATCPSLPQRPNGTVCATPTPAQVCRANATCLSGVCPSTLPNQPDGTGCPWLLSNMAVSVASAGGETWQLTPAEEADTVDASGGGRTNKECRANCQNGMCVGIPPVHKCCYANRPNPNHPSKTIKEWYCRRRN